MQLDRFLELSPILFSSSHSLTRHLVYSPNRSIPGSPDRHVLFLQNVEQSTGLPKYLSPLYHLHYLPIVCVARTRHTLLIITCLVVISHRKSTKGKTSHKSRHAASASTTATSNNSSRVTRNAAELPAAAPILVGIPDSFITTPADRPAAAANSIAQPENRATQQQKRKKVSTSAATSVSKPKQTKPSATHKIERARGVLYGLSTLKRQGNVRVNVMADHTTVKSNFLLGPLQLRVEKAFGRGVKRELKSATATTTEMVGRIKLRIVNGAATLHSIKVQQPKQVQVVSADNHDRTREFVWKKSSHIADVVSQKLTSAVRSMLQPPPNAVTAKRSTQRKAKVMQF